MAYGSILGQAPIFPENPSTIATNVSYDNSSTSSAISSNNVQGAIDNLVTYVDNKQPTDLPWKLIKSIMLGNLSGPYPSANIIFPYNISFLKIVYHEFYIYTRSATTLNVNILANSNFGNHEISLDFYPIGKVSSNQNASLHNETTIVQTYPIIQNYLNYNYGSICLIGSIDDSQNGIQLGVETEITLANYNTIMFSGTNGMQVDFYYI